VTVTSDKIPLQNGSGTLNYTTPTAGSVSVVVQDTNGNTLRQVTLKAAQGANTWNWNGADNGGRTLPDGAYTVSVTSGTAGGAPATAVPFTVVGTATGVTAQNNSVNLQLGALSVPFSSVNSVAN